MGIYSLNNIGKERYPALTGVRAIGAMAVFFGHLPFSIGFSLTVNVIVLFFVLSGFLIFYMYYSGSELSSKQLSRYFVNRFARIYPVYFLLVSIAIWYNHDFRPLLLFKNYTLTHALFNNSKDILIEPSWTLTVEECFYLLAPLLMFITKRIAFGLALLFGTVLAALAILVSFAPFSFLHTPLFVMTTTFFGFFFAFYAGAWLALQVMKREEENIVKVKGMTRTISGLLATLLVLTGTAFIYRSPAGINYTLLIVLNNFLLPVAVTLLYYGLITEDTLLARLLSGRLMGLLGRTSYSFYLLHPLVIEMLARPYIQPYFVDHYNLFVIIIFILTQLLAFGLYALYEEPLNVFIRKIRKPG
jgi:peptidoglycan/LPS O-acetylase OafA/YrhL